MDEIKEYKLIFIPKKGILKHTPFLEKVFYIRAKNKATARQVCERIYFHEIKDDELHLRKICLKET